MTSGQNLDPAIFDDPALADLVAKAMDIQDAGEILDLEELCVDHPHLVGAVNASLYTGSQILSLQKGHAGFDRRKGRVLADRYRLNQRLGSGAMGVVYGATDLDLGRKVAVKILRSGFLETHEAEQRFTREAEAMAAVTHPSVITVYDRGRTEDGEAFLVMELLEGASLGSLLDTATDLAQSGQRASTDWVSAALAGGRLDESTFLRAATRWTADLASGLAAAHAAGVYHRDVKPSNVFIRRDGTPVLLDFGIAARTDEHTITRDGSAVGTPAYMAPEAFANDASPSPSLDVYSLTATLYHLLTDKAPYTGTPSQVIASLITDGPTPAYKLEPGMPRDLQAILDKGMARRVSDRYASVAELESDLRAFLVHQPVKARPISRVTRTWRKVRRMPVFWVLLLGVLATCGGLAWRDVQLERAAKDLGIYHEAERHIPPNLIYGGLDNRILTEAEGKDAVEEYLNTMVEHRAAPLPSLMTRMAFRLDHTNAAGAASDMRTVAADIGTEYASALADRYAALSSDAQGAYALDIEDLPEPKTPDDLYLDAIHAFRGGKNGRFKERIGNDLLDGYPGVESLRLILTVRTQTVSAYERLLAIEASGPRRTAQTAFQIGGALTILRRFSEAEDAFHDALELAPGSFRTHENLGLVKWCLDDMPEAVAHLEQSIAFKPNYPEPQYLLIRVLIDERTHLDEAEALLAKAPRRGTKRSRLWAMTLGPEILAERSFRALIDGDAEAAQEMAKRAVAGFDKTAPKWPEYPKEFLAPVLSRLEIARAVATDDGDLFGTLLRHARLSGLRRVFLTNARRFLPPGTTPELEKLLSYLADEHSARSTRSDLDELRTEPDASGLRTEKQGTDR